MKYSVVGLCLVLLLGCAQMCRFGENNESIGFQCVRVFSKATVGMTEEEVLDRIGPPSRKSSNVEYQGKTYDEAWIYQTTPPTILYIKNGVLKHKEYQL